MKVINASTSLALFLQSCLVSASLETRQVPTAKYTLTGYSSTGTPYPYYNISVPENGVTVSITNPLIVYSISPEAAFIPGPFTPTSNCTFTLEDGTLAYVDSTYDIIPQKVVSVSCVPLPSTPSASSSAVDYYPTAASVYPSATSPFTVSGALPPYPTATGGYSTAGRTGSYGSAGPSATGTGSTPGERGVVAFTGGAGRAGLGFRGLVGALVGAGLVL